MQKTLLDIYDYSFAEVEQLLESGADINIEDGNGFTPLHNAALRNHA